MKNKKQFYILSLFAISMILVVLLIFTGMVSFGSFQNSEKTGTVVQSVSGDVTIRRDVNNYQLKAGMELFQEDTILVGRNSECRIVTEGLLCSTLDKNSVFQILTLSPEENSFSVLEGAVFFDMDTPEDQRQVSLVAGDVLLTPDPETALSIENYPGTQNINLYSGGAEFLYEGNLCRLSPADQCSIIQEKGEQKRIISKVIVQELRNFLLQELLNRDGLCFETAALNSALSTRSIPVTVSDTVLPAERMTCTLEIRCDSVLNKPTGSSLDIPKNGTILPTTEIRFSRGESVFDILQRVCRNEGIPMDYTYTVLYEGFYVSEIAGFRELTNGPYSGWLYKVNGWYPNYGSSNYEVNEGDEIVWAYTCNGGIDLGREDWITQNTGN